MTTSINNRASHVMTQPRPLVRVTMGFIAVAIIFLFYADIEITTLNPWEEIVKMSIGAVTPDFFETDYLFSAIINTIAFAMLGVAVGNLIGFFLALVFHIRFVRAGCAFLRAVHELFWALIFLQVFGLSALTGVLALAIPYSGIFAKVYSEILEEADTTSLKTIPDETSQISVFMYARLPDAWAHFKTYSLYRLECGLRSSAVLGFVGLPTLGFHLETAFAEGKYSEASAILIIFFIIIATIRKWSHTRLVPIYIFVSLIVIPWGLSDISLDNLIRFFTNDILPHPIRTVESVDVTVLINLGNWIKTLFLDQALPGIIATIVLTQIAMVGAGFLTLILFPLISPKFFGVFGRSIGHVFLVIARSTPEYILALICLLIWGPSMLPAIIALSLHNGAIIGHLIGRFTESMKLRPDRPWGINLYAYDLLPRIYRQFLAFLFYRWEVIMRETAILGILGITTLGFYIDSAFADLRYDKAIILILVTAIMNLGIDILSRNIRSRLRLQTRINVV